jgi:hypothetical protein
MSICRDIDDTASLPIDNTRSSNVYPLRSDDTARMRMEATGRDYREHGGMHPFAESIIRFFRARTILEGELADGRWQRAWKYLERLSPHDLPPASRRDFFELTYFVQQQRDSGAFDREQFRFCVRAIASQLDTFVDQLNADLDG